MDDSGSFFDYLTISLLKDRTLYLDSDIDETVSSDLVKSFHLLSKEPGPIILLITTEGGRVTDAEALVHSIRYAQHNGCTVIGEVRGYAMSAGVYVLQNCDMRYAGANDILMVHGISGFSVGDLRNQQADTKLANDITKRWAKFFSERNTSSTPQYHNYTYWKTLFLDSLPHYYFGDEAVNIGLVDEVIN